MILRTLWKRAEAKYHSDGLISTLTTAIRFITTRVVRNGFSFSGYQTDCRTDIEERWHMMEGHISSEDTNLLDIGCAEGLLTKRFAKKGLFCLGIDRSWVPLMVARKKHVFERIGFAMFEITPENINTLPSTDIVLLLNVYHHWGDDYGWDSADDMLRTVARKSNKVFFELPGQELDKELPGVFADESFADYHEGNLERIFDHDDSVEFEYIGTASRTEGEVSNPLFVIYCAEWDQGS